jgi:hypothetical protein
MAANGCAWSQSLETANFFAGEYWRSRGAYGQGIVVQARIARRFIKAAIDERGEQELVVSAFPDQLGSLERLSLNVQIAS